MKLNTARQHLENIKKERNDFMLSAQQMAKSTDTIRRERDALQLETENLRANVKDVELMETQLNAEILLCDSIEKEREIYRLKSQNAAGKRVVMMKDMGTLKVEKDELLAKCKKSAPLEKQLKAVSQQCENMKKQRDAFILIAKRTATDRETIRKEVDALRLEVQHLITQHYDAIVQELFKRRLQ
jgi:hypothetical protein